MIASRAQDARNCHPGLPDRAQSSAQWHLDDDFTMRVGPAQDGDLLEVGVLDIDTDDPVIVHAMRARPQYLPHR
jgi:hypothetical protein